MEEGKKNTVVPWTRPDQQSARTLIVNKEIIKDNEVILTICLDCDVAQIKINQPTWFGPKP